MQNTTDMGEYVPLKPIPTYKAEGILQLMANILNYLNVSLYEGTFTYKHEQARAGLNTIYDAVSAAPTISPSLNECRDFYYNMECLTNVTDTDDPNYYIYKRALRNHINIAAGL
jgi:glutamate formiminotransferase